MKEIHFKLFNSVLSDLNLTSNAKLLFSIIYSRYCLSKANKDNLKFFDTNSKRHFAMYSNAKLKELLRFCSEQSVRNSLKNLVENEYIELSFFGSKRLIFVNESKINKKEFSILKLSTLQNEHIKSTEKLILAYLTSCNRLNIKRNKTDSFSVLNKKISEILNKSISTVQKAISKLTSLRVLFRKVTGSIRYFYSKVYNAVNSLNTYDYINNTIEISNIVSKFVLSSFIVLITYHLAKLLMHWS